MARTILRFYIIFYIICCISTSTSVDIQPTPTHENKQNHISKEPNHTENIKENEKTLIKISSGNTDKSMEKSEVKKNISPGKVTTSKISAENATIKNNVNAEIESGAVMRGVYVFVGITLLFIMYIAFKTYRRGNRKNIIIKKYGVKTRRSDLEMEPLPLDEDEDDETVFDLGNLNNR